MLANQSPLGSVPVTATNAEGTLPLGAHLISLRRGYVHHGIYVGAGRVIHYGGFHRPGDKRPIETVSLECFAGGRGYQLIAEPRTPYSASQIVLRASSRLGENRYSLFFNNCEHFCEWCIHGIARSKQVRSTLSNPWRLIQLLVAVAHLATESLDIAAIDVGQDPCGRDVMTAREARSA